MNRSFLSKLSLLAAVSVTLLFQNCSQFLSTDASASRGQLVSHKVFMSTQSVEEDALGQILVSGNGSAGGTVTQIQDCLANGECDSNGEILVLRGPRSFEQPVRYYCSNNWTGLAGSNVTASSGLKVAFVKSDNTVACEVSSATLKDGVMNQKKLSAEIAAAACPNLVSGTYTMLVTGAADTVNTDTSLAITRRSMIIGNDNHDRPQPYMVKVEVDGRGYITLEPANGKTPFILYKQNQGGSANAQCEEVNSPLVVQLTERPRKIRLSAPLLGVLFDILGLNDTPAHSLHRISWFSSGDAVSHYFIALPDSSGRVTGINQLFGNNTQGPDGQFASDGYAALAKWDSNNDGQITAADPVYLQLRFWSDRNINGVAETIELYRLDELAIKSIDLNYDPNFAEVDRWGNEIKMKSVVENQQGDMFLMYDIWFRRID